MHGIDFSLSEDAYHWRFLKFIGQHDLAEEAIKAPSPAEAKAVAACVPKHLHKDWHLIKKSIMKVYLLITLLPQSLSSTRAVTNSSPCV